MYAMNSKDKLLEDYKALEHRRSKGWDAPSRRR